MGSSLEGIGAMAFNKSADQDVIDERDAMMASTKGKPSRKARVWRQALEAFDHQQMLHEFGIKSWELDYD